MKNIVLSVLCTLLIMPAFAQDSKEITLDLIWNSGEFRSERVPGFNFLNDGKHYTKRDGSQIYLMHQK